jgi:hypothetical protein
MKDPIEKEKLKIVFVLLLDEFKKLDTDRLAYRKVIDQLKTQYPDLDDVFQAMQIHPAVVRAVNEKYTKILKDWNSQLDLMESVSEFFASWKPTGPIN